jgi:uncharacterized protein (TIRG00374 family)
MRRRLESLAFSRGARAGLVLFSLAIAGLLLWWRGPDWNLAYHAYDLVEWRWIVAAVVLNFISVCLRAFAWRVTINQALSPPHPPFGNVFSAFGVGLLGNAVLPARAGELARVAVLRRRLPHGRGTSATLIGTVFAHRLFDLPAVALLVVYVVLTARLPHWAITSLIGFGIVSVVLLAVGFFSARRHSGGVVHDGASAVRRLLMMARQGLAVLKTPTAGLLAVVFQCAGWMVQLVAVYAVMRAFGIHEGGLPVAGLVLLLMNVATIFPLWPGNVGLLQAAVALPLTRYGVDYATGFAFGLGLQVLEMSVGIGIGLAFLAREGLSFASLKAIEDDAEQTMIEEISADESGFAENEEASTVAVGANGHVSRHTRAS